MTSCGTNKMCIKAATVVCVCRLRLYEALIVCSSHISMYYLLTAGCSYCSIWPRTRRVDCIWQHGPWSRKGYINILHM